MSTYLFTYYLSFLLECKLIKAGILKILFNTRSQELRTMPSTLKKERQRDSITLCQINKEITQPFIKSFQDKLGRTFL